MKKSKEPAPISSSIDFELPDWGGMEDSSYRIKPEAAFRLMEEYASVRSQLRLASHPDRQKKCEVEFVL